MLSGCFHLFGLFQSTCSAFIFPPACLLQLDLQGIAGGSGEAPFYRRLGFWARALSLSVSLAFYVAGTVMLVVSPNTVSWGSCS